LKAQSHRHIYASAVFVEATQADGLERVWCRGRERGRILPNGASVDTIGAVLAKCPNGALPPGASGDERRR